MGDMWVWGADVAKARLGLGFVELHTGAFQTNAVSWRGKSLPLADDLRLADEDTYRFARLMAETFPPATVAVEIPMGMQPEPTLLATFGVVVRALHRALELAPWEINVSTWKRCYREEGTDLSKKPNLLPWIQGLGYQIDDVDQAAAAAIGGAARKLFYGKPTTDLHP